MKRSHVARCGTVVRDPDARDELLERGVPVDVIEDQTPAWCAGYLRGLRDIEAERSERNLQ